MAAIKGFGLDIHSPRLNGSLETLRHDLARCAACGFDYAEIPVHGLDAVLGGRLHERRVREVQEILAGFSLRYTVHAPDPLNLMDVERLDLHKAVFAATLAFAQDIGAEVITYHAGRVDALNEKSGYTLEEMQAVEREALREMGERAAQAGVKIGVENGSLDSYSSVLEALVEQVEGVGHPAVGVTLDFGHAFLTAHYHRFDYIQAVRATAAHIVHMHVHDNFGWLLDLPFDVPYIYAAPFGIGDLHMPPGWGAIPYEEVFAGLRLRPTAFLMELNPRYADAFPEALAEAQRLAALMEAA